MFETAAGGGPLIYCEGGEIFVQLIVGDLFGKAVKVQTDKSNPANVIVKGTLALTL